MPKPVKHSDRTSVYQLSGLPGAFGKTLLTISLVLVLTPYFAGDKIGPVDIPDCSGKLKEALKVVGPVVFMIMIGVHLPLVRVRRTAGEREPERRQRGLAAAETLIAQMGMMRKQLESLPAADRAEQRVLINSIRKGYDDIESVFQGGRVGLMVLSKEFCDNMHVFKNWIDRITREILTDINEADGEKSVDLSIYRNEISRIREQFAGLTDLLHRVISGEET